MGIHFLAGALLWTAAGAAVPVIIHLASRARPEVLLLPTVRFLREARRSERVRLRLKQLLLLALRIACIALFAAALARPCVTVAGIASSGGRLTGSGVIILDASCSMRAREGDRVRWDTAKEFARRLAELFSPESRLGLIVAGGAGGHEDLRPTIDHELLRVGIDAAECSWGGPGLPGAVAEAERMLRGEPAGRSSIFVVTDLTMSAWRPFDKAVEAQRARGDASARELPPIWVFDASGGRECYNGAVVDIECASESSSVGEAVEVRAAVQTSGRTAWRGRESLLVELYVDGAKADQAVVTVAAARRGELRMTAPPQGLGLHAMEVRLVDSDGLPEDNARRLIFATGHTRSVLLVDCSPEADGRGTRGGSARFLKAAMAPMGAGAAAMNVVEATRSELASALANKPDCVVLSEAGALAPDAWEALRKYVAEGGGLLVTLGARSKPEDLRRNGYHELAENMGLLPGLIGDPVTLSPPARLAASSPEHPVLRVFRGGMNGALSAASFERRFELRLPEADSAARVILAFGDRAPGLVEKRYGRGAVLLFTSSMDASWGTLPREMCFVPLVHSCVRHLSPRAEATGALEVGQAPHDDLAPGGAPGGTIEVLDPSSAGWRSWESGSRQPGRLHLAPLDRPGFWGFRLKAAPGAAEVQRMYAVNIPAEESDLTRIEPEELAGMYGDRLHVSSSPDELAAEGRLGGREITAWLWPLVAVLLLAEGFAANRLYRPAGEGPSGTEAAGKKSPGGTSP